VRFCSDTKSFQPSCDSSLAAYAFQVLPYLALCPQSLHFLWSGHSFREAYVLLL